MGQGVRLQKGRTAAAQTRQGLNSLKQLMRSAANIRDNPDNLEKQAEAEQDIGVRGNNNAEGVSNTSISSTNATTNGLKTTKTQQPTKLGEKLSIKQQPEYILYLT